MANFYQPDRHAHLYRWPSQPSLRRRWTCHRCGLENISVAWHCLNCDSVSLLAPIYKGTLARERSVDSAIEPKHTPAPAAAAPPPAAMRGDEDRGGGGAGGAGAGSGFKCYLCMYRAQPPASNNNLSSNNADEQQQQPLPLQRCRHQHMRMRAKHLRFPLTSNAPSAAIADTGAGRNQPPPPQSQYNQPPQQYTQQYQPQSSASRSTTSTQQQHCHQPGFGASQPPPHATSAFGAAPQQKSFDGATGAHINRTAVSDGLYYSNRRINKSLSSITDFVLGPQASASHSTAGSEIYDTVFGERIRPKLLLAATGGNGEQQQQQQPHHSTLLRRSLSKGSDPSPTSSAFEQWPTLTMQSPSHYQHTTRTFADYAGTGGGGGRCLTKSPAESIGSSGGGGGGTGHFTITTLSRSGDSSRSTTASKRSLPRNGGVFVAVGSWSVAPPTALPTLPPQMPALAMAAVTVPSPSQTSQDTLGYEILKNPYAGGGAGAGHFYANQPQSLAMGMPQLQPLQPQLPSEPIYAVVNKSNKSRHKTGVQPSSQPPPIAQTTFQQQARAIDTLYASILGNQLPPTTTTTAAAASAAAADSDLVDGCGASAESPHGSGGDASASYITISNGVQEPGSDTSDIYAKVWKGPRNVLDSQRK